MKNTGGRGERPSYQSQQLAKLKPIPLPNTREFKPTSDKRASKTSASKVHFEPEPENMSPEPQTSVSSSSKISLLSLVRSIFQNRHISLTALTMLFILLMFPAASMAAPVRSGEADGGENKSPDGQSTSDIARYDAKYFADHIPEMPDIPKRHYIEDREMQIMTASDLKTRSDIVVADNPAQASSQTDSTTKYPELTNFAEIKFSAEFAIFPALYVIQKLFLRNSGNGPAANQNFDKSDLIIGLLKYSIGVKPEKTGLYQAVRIRELLSNEQKSDQENQELKDAIFSIISPLDLFVACIVWKDFARNNFNKVRDQRAKQMIDESLDEIEGWFMNKDPKEYFKEQIDNLAKVFVILEEKPLDPKVKEKLKKDLAAKFGLALDGKSLEEQVRDKKNDAEFKEYISDNGGIENLLRTVEIAEFNPLAIYRNCTILFFEIELQNLIEAFKEAENRGLSTNNDLKQQLEEKFGLAPDEKPISAKLEQKKQDHKFKQHILKQGGIEKLLIGVDTKEFDLSAAYNRNNEEYLKAAKKELGAIFSSFKQPPTNIDQAFIYLFRYGYVFGGCVFAGINGLTKFSIKAGINPNFAVPLIGLCLCCSYYANDKFSLAFDDTVMKATDLFKQVPNFVTESIKKMGKSYNWTKENILHASMLAAKFIFLDIPAVVAAASTSSINTMQPIASSQEMAESINKLVQANAFDNKSKVTHDIGYVSAALTFPIMTMVLRNDIESLAGFVKPANLMKAPTRIANCMMEHTMFSVLFLLLETAAVFQTLGFGLSAHNTLEKQAGSAFADYVSILTLVGRFSLASRSVYIAADRLEPVFQSMCKGIIKYFDRFRSGYVTQRDESSTESDQTPASSISSILTSTNKILHTIFDSINWKKFGQLSVLTANGLVNSGLVSHPLKLPKSMGESPLPEWLYGIIATSTAITSISICSRFLALETGTERKKMEKYLNSLAQDDEALSILARKVETEIRSGNPNPDITHLVTGTREREDAASNNGSTELLEFAAARSPSQLASGKGRPSPVINPQSTSKFVKPPSVSLIQE